MAGANRLVRTWRIAADRVFAELFGGILLGAARRTRLITVTYSATPTVNAALGNDFVVTITDAVAFVVAAPTNTPPAGFAQDITITFRNASGGAHGAGTWNAIFRTQATVFPAIANGQSRTVFFRWNETNWVELVRTAADVAN